MGVLTKNTTQALFMNRTRNTIWRRIIRSLKVEIFNKNGLPYSIRVLFTPGVVILQIQLDLKKTRIQKNRLNQVKSVK